ncbi:MAG: hypothetical protein AB1791_14535 [Chloroflexota bacterium]
MVEVTVRVPETLAERLSSVGSRLPEILAHGLDKLSPLPNEVYRYILEFLVSRPSPQEVVNFGPTLAMQKRVSELLERNRSDNLTPAEASELDEYLRINHLVTMLKARALPYLLASS